MHNSVELEGCRLRHGFRVSRELREESVILGYIAWNVLVLRTYLIMLQDAHPQDNTGLSTWAPWIFSYLTVIGDKIAKMHVIVLERIV